MALGLDPSTVLEVIATRSDGSRHRGSGQLMAPGRALTARHVLADAASVTVRFDAMLPTEKLLAADVLLAPPDEDIAILGFTGENRKPARGWAFGRVPEHDTRLTCSVMGFPFFKARRDHPDEVYRDAFHVGEAFCDVLSNRKEGTLDLTVPPPGEAVPTGGAPWGGMSGAVVWCGAQVVGVVTRHYAGDGASHLTVSRADRWHARLTPADLHRLEQELGVRLGPEHLVGVGHPAAEHDWPPPQGRDAWLRTYLKGVKRSTGRHPYRLGGPRVPPLHTVYLRQTAARRPGDAAAVGGSAQGGPVAEPPPVAAEEVVARHRGAQIVGGPGAGKSSLLHTVARNYAETQPDGTLHPFIPILMQARDLGAGPGGLTERLVHAVEREGTALGHAELVDLLSSPPPRGTEWLGLVDGIDEVPSWLRDPVLRDVENLRDRLGWRVVLASRELADGSLEHIRDDDHPTYAIEPFRPAQLSEFALQWFRAAGTENPEHLAQAFTGQLESARRLRELARIPLIATMLCVVFAEEPSRDLPVNRAELYHRFTQVLIHRSRDDETWERYRTLVGPHGAAAEEAITNLLGRLPRQLEWAAYTRRYGTGGRRRKRRKGEPRDPAPVVELIRDRLPRPDTIDEMTWKDLVEGAVEHSGLLERRQGELHFLHASIEEYLAAKHLLHADSSRALTRSRPESDEAEVMIFLAGIEADEDPAALERHLTRLLRRRPTEGSHFVADLHRNGIRVPPGATERAARTLHATVIAFDKGILKPEWGAACDDLAEIDSQRLLRALEELCTVPRRNGYARLTGADEALRRDVSTGLRLMNVLLNDQALESGPRYLAAKSVHDRTGMVEALARLADDVTMGNERIQAAEEVNRVSSERGLACFRRMTDAPRPVGDGLNVVRAAQVFAQCHPQEGTQRLTELSRNRTLTSPQRIEAAEAAFGRGPHFGATETAELLAAICNDRALPERERMIAGIRAGRLDPRIAGRALIDLAGSCTKAGGLLPVDVLKEASTFLSQLAEEALKGIARGDGPGEERMRAARTYRHGGDRWLWEDLARDGTLSEDHRIEAATTADRTPYGDRTATNLRALAEDEQLSSGGRLRAATAAMELAPAEGITAMRAVALSPRTPSRIGLAAARAVPQDAHTAKRELLVALIPMLRRATDRIEAAIELGRLDPAAATAYLKEIALCDKKPAPARLQAARGMGSLDAAQAMAVLRQLAELTDLSAVVRRKAARAADKLERSGRTRSGRT
ncbi:trypsin-like peptidase domain-containing protein [Streptomyces sp. SL13]|uniref:Trypsin-like peptidase domain-containing protein n=1 Tax=Streptantibioticus silvisoli TaxID=2705255 RepID=A0AA90H5Y1_9ACTN|nr:trypsin-like peptidase domain-containing protein [Streptantibioticus silvisoli]MDI5969410.1 trypsin-like peptidase domain-containing protein [Streptantibioticus silvisoli]